MGQAKHAMMEAEEKRADAISIAVRAGVLEYCDRHSVHFGPIGDVTDAYKLGNFLLKNGELSANFDNSRDMTDYVKEVVEQSADECYACAKFRDED